MPHASFCNGIFYAICVASSTANVRALSISPNKPCSHNKSGLWKGVLKDDFDLTSIDYAKVKAPIQILLM